MALFHRHPLFTAQAGNPTRFTTSETLSGAPRIRRLSTLVFAINLVSAALFIASVDRQVYDEPFNINDVHLYATQGVSLTTLRQHKNPSGPTSDIWMAAFVRILGGKELLDARIGVLFSWLLLFIAIRLGARKASSPHLWYGALLVSLVFPHSMEATATVLTEGPALFFATLGFLVWSEIASRSIITPRIATANVIAGLCMGLAFTSRQYYLALIPAATLLILWQIAYVKVRRDSRWAMSVLISLAAGLIPMVSLILAWKGLSSPSMVSGTSYPNVISKVGLNPFRVIVACFYTAFYLVPLTFPAMCQLKGRKSWHALWMASLAGVAVSPFASSILQPGPLNTVIHGVARTAILRTLLFGSVGVLTIYNTIALGSLVWLKRSSWLSSPHMILAIFMVILFVGEQIGVGGTASFYDRYVFQLAPFFGVIAFSLLPQLSKLRLVALAAMLIVSQMMLWRHAFGA